MPNPHLFDAIFRAGSSMSAAAGEVIFKEGEAAECSYLIDSGCVILSFVSKCGNSVWSQTAGPGTILSLAPAIGRSPHLFTAVALEQTDESRIHLRS